MSKFRVYLLSLLAFCFSTFAFAEVPYDDPSLIGGRVAESGEFPEVVYISMTTARCSATIVGPRVLITAAHCVSNGQTASFQVDQEQFTSKCERSSLYPRRDHDLALCLISKDVDVRYASIGKVPVVKESAVLAGYGCVRAGGGGGNDGKLRVGKSKITGFSGYDFVTAGQAALCYGDSGGATFHDMSDFRSEHHWLMGVNSKGDIRTTSYLARTDRAESTEFFKKFAEKHKVEICGVNKDCDRPENEGCEAEAAVVDAAKIQLADAEKLLKECRAKVK